VTSKKNNQRLLTLLLLPRMLMKVLCCAVLACLSAPTCNDYRDKKANRVVIQPGPKLFLCPTSDKIHAQAPIAPKPRAYMFVSFRSKSCYACESAENKEERVSD
jgi:hypothetical protein